MKGGGFLGVAGGNWGRPGAPQQHRQPLADPSFADSTDPKISAIFNVTFTSSRSSVVRTLDRRTSWAPRRNNTKAAAPSSKELPLPSTPSFWVWVAPSTTNTRWALILKKLTNLLPSFMYILSTTLLNLSIPDANYPVPLPTLIRSRINVKPANLLIPVDFFLNVWWRSFTVTSTKVNRFS